MLFDDFPSAIALKFPFTSVISHTIVNNGFHKYSLHFFWTDGSTLHLPRYKACKPITGPLKLLAGIWL